METRMRRDSLCVISLKGYNRIEYVYKNKDNIEKTMTTNFSEIMT